MVQRTREILTLLDAAGSIEGPTAQAFAFMLSGANRRGFWTVTVRASWRVIFPFVNAKTLDVDFVDYH
jgi:toxin HigB-1